MKTIPIYPQDIVANTRYMHDSQGRFDLLGQILYTGYNIQIPMKTRTPQELSRGIHPFTVIIRQHTFSNTCLTLSLLELSPLPGKRQVLEANKLLLPYNIELVVASEAKQVEEVIEGEVSTPYWKEANLTLSNLTRTSWYSCSCGHSSTVDNMINNNDYTCRSCKQPISTEHLQQIKLKFPKA